MAWYNPFSWFKKSVPAPVAIPVPIAVPVPISMALVISESGEIVEAVVFNDGAVEKCCDDTMRVIVISNVPPDTKLSFETRLNWNEIPKHFKRKLDTDKKVTVEWNQIKGYLVRDVINITN